MMISYEENIRKFKAEQRRIKKAIVRYVNLDYIKNDLWEIQEACEEVRWFTESEEGKDIIENVLDGDEDEAWEFQMMFADLCAECEQMLMDMDDEYIPDCFDDLFVAAHGSQVGGGLFGWDEYEGDYMGIQPSWNCYAEDESCKRIFRLTKKELIECMSICTKVFMSYIGLRSRYDDLKASMDILRNQNQGHLKVIKRIEELYEAMGNKDWSKYSKEAMEWNRLTNALPQEAWIQ